jgi:hypothetical protein
LVKLTVLLPVKGFAFQLMVAHDCLLSMKYTIVSHTAISIVKQCGLFCSSLYTMRSQHTMDVLAHNFVSKTVCSWHVPSCHLVAERFTLSSMQPSENSINHYSVEAMLFCQKSYGVEPNDWFEGKQRPKKGSDDMPTCNDSAEEDDCI